MQNKIASLSEGVLLLSLPDYRIFSFLLLLKEGGGVGTRYFVGPRTLSLEDRILVSVLLI